MKTDVTDNGETETTIPVDFDDVIVPDDVIGKSVLDVMGLSRLSMVRS
jgi:hypothetical protein